MKKIIGLVLILGFISSCTKEDILLPETQNVSEKLQMSESVGIKLETTFVSEKVNMNVKIETAGKYVVKITDIADKVVSKEEIDVKSGDNVVTINTGIIPPSAYRLKLYSPTGVILGVTDFNKL
jgi:hypothetical protein